MSKIEEIEKRRIKVLKLYKEGLSLKDIAQRLSCEKTTVVNDLKTLRENDPNVPSRRHRCSKAELEKRRSEILRLNKKGLKPKEIAKELAVHYYLVLDDLNFLESAGEIKSSLKRRRKKISKSDIEKRRAKVLALYNEGLIPEEIAERLCCHARKVYDDLKVLGI